MKTALVTGGNRGIGLEVCRALATRGFRVLLGARELHRGEAAAQGLGAPGAGVVAVEADVSSEHSIARLAERARSEGWQLDALVNNAGVSLSGFDERTASATLETNLFGAMRISDALLSHMSDGACIVNVSSGMGELRVLGPPLREKFEAVSDRSGLLELARQFIEDVRAGRHAAKGWPPNAYSVSKVALNAFTRLLAAEAPRLHVNSVCPGWVRTEMGGSSAPRSAAQGARGIVWAATLPPNGPTGGFHRDERRIPW